MLLPGLADELRFHQLAQRWHCTPDAVRAQPAEDVEFALALLEAEANAAEHRRALDEQRRTMQGG